MTLIPLLTIPIIFLLTTLIKPRLKKHVKWNFCAICVAVSLTWIFLIAIRSAGTLIDTLPIGILMGMSVTGVMYKIESIYKKQSLKHLWFMRLVIVIGGFYAILAILKGAWGLASLVVITTFVMGIIVSFLLQGVTHQENSHPKKLDNCC
ncbi:MAG: hypothetical protein AAB337_02715 [Patescibacteria group bacterium]